MYPELPDLILEIKNRSLAVKLDTNGTNPTMLKMLLEKRLLDYVAMDIKAPWAKYKQICGVDYLLEKIKESTDLLLMGQVPYEFRTTFIPELSREEILEIAQIIKGARLYILQQYRLPELPADEKKVLRLQKSPHSVNYIRKTAQQVAQWVQACETRGI